MNRARCAWGIAVVGALVPGCRGAAPTTGADHTSPAVTVGATVRGDTVTLSSFATDPDGLLTSHRLLLNGTEVRSATASVVTIIDTILPQGTHVLVGEATSAGGSASADWPFVVRVAHSPIAPSRSFDVPEAGSLAVDLRLFTSGEPDRTFKVPPHPLLVIEQVGSVVRVRAAGNAVQPADDFIGSVVLPYEVQDRHGIASGLLTFTFQSQPDLTVTEVVDLRGRPLLGQTARMSLNFVSHHLGVGSRIQATAGKNLWHMWVQSDLKQFVALQIEGHDELAFNLNHLVDSLVLGPEDRDVRLILLPADLSVDDPACVFPTEFVYKGILADTTSTVQFIVMTDAQPGRTAIAVGGTSYVRWREAFDSLVAEEGRDAALVGRQPRTLVFTTDLETPPRVEVTPEHPEGRPAAGQVWIYDSLLPPNFHPRWFGGRNFRTPAGDVVSGIAWSTTVAEMGRRRLALAEWQDRTFGRVFSPSECTRHVSGGLGTFLTGNRTAWEAEVLPRLHEQANRMIRANGNGYLYYTQLYQQDP